MHAPNEHTVAKLIRLRLFVYAFPLWRGNYYHFKL